MKLIDYLKAQRIKQSEFAQMLDPVVTDNAVSSWIHGRSLPTLTRAVEIQRVTRGKVRPADWFAPEAND